MEYLFTARNLKVLESFAMVKTLYAFDFDGTLAPIVDNPMDSAISQKLSEKLLKFQEKVQIAIITGRKVSDVLQRLPFTPNFVLGNHGLEGGLTDEELSVVSRIRTSWIDILSDQIGHHLDPMNIAIEDKVYSLSLHFRNSPDPVAAHRMCLKAAKMLPAAKITEGKMVINILPQVGVNKGSAFEKLLLAHDFPFSLYIGDDVTDEDIFVLSNPNTLTIRIGADPQSKAKYYLKSQEEIEQLLDHLLSFSYS